MKLKLIKFNCVKSTNDQAIKIIRSKQKRQGIVVSNLQTNGKGTRGKKWISRKGNFFASIFFELKETLPDFKEFSLINPIIVSKILNQNLTSKVKIKLPNDLLIKSRKVCGILQELIQFEKKYFLIIGIGINTRFCPTEKNLKATSLAKHSNKFVNNSKILQSLKKNYEAIFYNYKFNKKLLRKVL